MTKQYHVTKKRITAFALVLALLLGMVPASTSFAAKKVSLSNKKLTIKVGKSKKLKLKNNKKKVTWKVVSGKNKIKLKAKKKTGVTIVAKKKGKAKVQAKVGKKKYTCQVTVKGKSASGDSDDDDDTNNTQEPADPNATADVTASEQPSETTNPGGSDPGQTQKPGSSSNPVQTQNPGSSDPTQTQQPGGSDPSQTQQPGGSDPVQTQNPGGSDPIDPSQTQQPGSSDPAQTEQPGGSDPVQTQNPGSSNPAQPTEEPVQQPGENIDLNGKTPFKIGSSELALGLNKDEVKKVLGTITREEKSPHGFDVIVYNPGNTYNGYTLVYLKDDAVVSICAIGTAGTVSYGDFVTTGDKASTLSSWSGVAWFEAKEGESKDGEGAYQRKDYNANLESNATVLAYVDYYRGGTGNSVYCIQVFSIDFDEMMKPEPGKCTYGPDVITAMEKETIELLTAYRVSCAYAADKYPTGQVLNLKEEEGLTTVARNWLDRCVISQDPPAMQNSDALKDVILTQNGNDIPMAFAQITLAGNADSIGFANSVLEKKTSWEYIMKLSHLTNTVPPNKYCYQYLGVAAKGTDGKYACMVIDLVDRWYASDPKWKTDDDDDDDDEYL